MEAGYISLLDARSGSILERFPNTMGDSYYAVRLSRDGKAAFLGGHMSAAMLSLVTGDIQPLPEDFPNDETPEHQR